MKRFDLYILAGLLMSLAFFAYTYLYSSTDAYDKVMETSILVLAVLSAIALYQLINALKKAKSPEARFFQFILIAFIFWILSEAAYTSYKVFFNTVPDISVADFFSILGYFSFIYAIYLFFENSCISVPSLLAVLATYLVVGLSVLYLLKDTIVNSRTSMVSNLLNAIYALLDSVELSLSVPLIIQFLSSPSKFRCSLIGVVILMVSLGDISALYFTAQNNPAAVQASDIFFVLGYIWALVVILIYPRPENNHSNVKQR